jgi:molybdopterin adenylyltransferase
MSDLQIISVNISEKKGTVKKPVNVVRLTSDGIQGDAHAGKWHRQVSLLGMESIEKMEISAGRKLTSGEFAENLTVKGIRLNEMRPLDRLSSGTAVLEVTQIGKKCHGGKCEIFKETGDCVMPTEGIFCRVISPGELRAGDTLQYLPKVMQVSIITMSDRASRGEYEDKSGPLLGKLVNDFFSAQGRKCAVSITVLPDEADKLESLIKKELARGVDMIFTTGGTGLGPRDITPEVIRPLLTKEIPGIMEMIRVKYGMQFPNAIVSRSLAGLSGSTLIYALPGSPKAVEEYASEILKTVEHSLRMIYGIDAH